jgi:uncharacterized protein (DUF849 family)
MMASRRWIQALLLQATLNGPFTKSDHAAIPTTLPELVADAVRCASAGARAFHVHARDDDQREQLTADVVNGTAAAIRRAVSLPVGVTTGAWIEPDLERRLAAIRAWTDPDYATVNLSEDGAEAVIAALIQAGIAVEAGVWTTSDVERLAGSGLAPHVLRVCIEPVELKAEEALEFVQDIHQALDKHGIAAPRLQHGDGEATWILLQDAVRREIATRIGLEDTFQLPDGSTASGNAALVMAAAKLGAGGN